MLCFKKRKLARLLKKASVLSQTRSTNKVSDSVLKKEIDLYKRIALLYEKLEGTKDFPFARLQSIECYRLMANIGDIESMRIMGEKMLNKGKFFLGLRGSYFYEEQIHEDAQQRCFEQAHAFLNTANNHEDPLARRLLGVLYVNGWGVDADIDKGLQLITSSLDLEKAWPRSSEIFAELGLNKPEFFAKLMAMKGGK